MKNLSIILIILFLGISVQSIAQETTKKLSRKEKKELKRKQDEAKKIEITQIIDAKTFVFEAYEIIDRKGNSYAANSNINFIIVDSNRVVFQIGSANKIGINGLGGVALEGEITKIDIKRNQKNGYTYIVMKIALKTGYYDIQMDISPSGTTRVKVSTSSYQKIVLVGDIYSFHDSHIYQGTTY